MTVKVLVTALGQQIVSEVKQIENKETETVVGYWLTQPRVVNYTRGEDDSIGINFSPYCLVSDEAEFSIRADHVVAILEPRDTVAEGWHKLVYPTTEETTTDENVTDESTTNEPEPADTEGSDSADVTDGAA